MQTWPLSLLNLCECRSRDEVLATGNLFEEGFQESGCGSDSSDTM